MASRAPSSIAARLSDEGRLKQFVSPLLKEWRGKPPITQEEEAALVLRANSDGADAVDAREELLAAHADYLLGRAKRYARNQNMDLADLWQAACVGFLDATTRFIPAAGVRLKTYAHTYVTGELAKVLGADRYAGHASKGLKSQRSVYVEAYRQLEQELHRTPLAFEVAAKLGHSSVDQVELLRQLGERPLALLDKPPGSDDSDETLLLCDTVPSAVYLTLGWDMPYLDQEQAFAQRDMREKLAELLDAIPKREADVLRIRYGIDMPDQDECSLEDIGRLLRISRQAVHKIETKALARLRDEARKRAWTANTLLRG